MTKDVQSFNITALVPDPKVHEEPSADSVCFGGDNKAASEQHMFKVTDETETCKDLNQQLRELDTNKEVHFKLLFRPSATRGRQGASFAHHY